MNKLAVSLAKLDLALEVMGFLVSLRIFITSKVEQ